jgi:hypothetical protein
MGGETAHAEFNKLLHWTGNTEEKLHPTTLFWKHLGITRFRKIGNALY